MENITMTTKEYTRTDSGKSWRSKPDSVETEQITKRQYDLITNEDTMKWFRRLGGSETATKNYTKWGYNTIELSSIDPARSLKRVRSFTFSD
jgi:hypothetical protein